MDFHWNLSIEEFQKKSWKLKSFKFSIGLLRTFYYLDFYGLPDWNLSIEEFLELYLHFLLQNRFRAPKNYSCTKIMQSPPLKSAILAGTPFAFFKSAILAGTVFAFFYCHIDSVTPKTPVAPRLCKSQPIEIAILDRDTLGSPSQYCNWQQPSILI